MSVWGPGVATRRLDLAVLGLAAGAGSGFGAALGEKLLTLRDGLRRRVPTVRQRAPGAVHGEADAHRQLVLAQLIEPREV